MSSSVKITQPEATSNSESTSEGASALMPTSDEACKDLQSTMDYTKKRLENICEKRAERIAAREKMAIVFEPSKLPQIPNKTELTAEILDNLPKISVKTHGDKVGYALGRISLQQMETLKQKISDVNSKLKDASDLKRYEKGNEDFEDFLQEHRVINEKFLSEIKDFKKSLSACDKTFRAVQNDLNTAKQGFTKINSIFVEAESYSTEITRGHSSGISILDEDSNISEKVGDSQNEQIGSMKLPMNMDGIKNEMPAARAKCHSSLGFDTSYIEKEELMDYGKDIMTFAYKQKSPINRELLQQVAYYMKTPEKAGESIFSLKDAPDKNKGTVMKVPTRPRPGKRPQKLVVKVSTSDESQSKAVKSKATSRLRNKIVYKPPSLYKKMIAGRKIVHDAKRHNPLIQSREGNNLIDLKCEMKKDSPIAMSSDEKNSDTNESEVPQSEDETGFAVGFKTTPPIMSENACAGISMAHTMGCVSIQKMKDLEQKILDVKIEGENDDDLKRFESATNEFKKFVDVCGEETGILFNEMKDFKNNVSECVQTQEVIRKDSNGIKEGIKKIKSIFVEAGEF